MRKLSRVLPDAVGQQEALRAARALTAMRRWEEVVGPFLAERSYPDRYQKGTVWVAVQGSAWAQELRMMKPKILERLREIAREPSLFEDIRFGVRPLPPGALQGPPEAPPEEPKDIRSLSIREIAAQRLANWKKDEEGA
jgi:predicted nucleic acid-binding Zn ribbon protein